MSEKELPNLNLVFLVYPSYDGASAIAEAANKILELEKYKEKNGITCNCGTIQGGTVPNVVPERCVFTLDVRFSDAEQYGSQYQPRGA